MPDTKIIALRHSPDTGHQRFAEASQEIILCAMSRQAISIKLTDEERSLLERILKAQTATQREVLRARIILMAAGGEEDKAIVEKLGLSPHSVAVWLLLGGD